MNWRAIFYLVALVATAVTYGGVVQPSRDGRRPAVPHGEIRMSALAVASPSTPVPLPTTSAAVPATTTTPPTTAPVGSLPLTGAEPDGALVPAKPTTAPPLVLPDPTEFDPTPIMSPAGVLTMAGLPEPEPLPTDAYAPTAERVIGRIEIPAIGVDVPLRQGMTLTAINRGPSQWPGTALPGELGNVVIGGHRTTYGQPFRNLDRLVAGDAIVISSDQGRYNYEVTAVEIVEPDRIDIADQTPEFKATLFACHPPGSVAQRIVVHTTLVDDTANPVALPAWLRTAA